MPLDQLLADDQEYAVHHGDCVEHMTALPDACVDFSVWSPPFPSLFSYSSEMCDIGNSEDLRGEAKLHISFFLRQFARLLKPGRICVIHCMQIPGLARNGEKGTFDFRGLIIRLAARAGLIYQYDWLVRKNPQALRNGSRVLTPFGWRGIESLVVNDYVIGADGKPVSVVGVHPQGIRPIFRVRTSDGASVDCDGRHLWSVRTTRGMSTNASLITMTTEAMANRGLFMPSGEPRFYLPIMASPAQFETTQLPVNPYLLGVLLGDGMLSSRGSVGICTQRGIVGLLDLPSGHRIRMLPGSEKGDDVCSWHILGGEWHRNNVLNSLRQLGLIGLRSWEKFIPDSYLFADQQSRRQLLAGLLDTDGGNKRTGGIKYHTTSPRLAEGFRHIIESLGGLCSLVKRSGGAYKHNGEERTGRDIYELTPRLRDDICPFKYRPKAEQWAMNKPIKGMRRAIVSIEPIGEAPCTCITVSAEDGLFVTENCIVTHNSQAIRTHSHKLLFVSLERDRAVSCGAMGDYLIKFIKPGDNQVPINSKEITREQWIDWAECCWTDIRETDTLNVREAKGENDTKHICPLQLGVIERLIKLYSNPGEIVFSPFAGIGSEGYQALKLGRRFYGCELKKEYYDTCLRNLERAKNQREESQRTMFDEITTVS